MGNKFASITNPDAYLAYYQQNGLFVGPPPKVIVLSYLQFPKTITPLPQAMPVWGGKGRQDAKGHAGWIQLSAMGAPAFAILFESLLAWGCRRFILLGLAGSLGKHSLGTIFIPNTVQGEDGTSKAYQQALQESSSPNVLEEMTFSPDIQTALAQACTPVSVAPGKVISTDAFFLETPTKLKNWQQQKCEAVDLECATLATLAQAYEAQAGAALVISDRLDPTQPWRPQFRSELITQASKHLIQAALEVAKSGKI